jgi:hypothetical protein
MRPPRAPRSLHVFILSTAIQPPTANSGLIASFRSRGESPNNIGRTYTEIFPMISDVDYLSDACLFAECILCSSELVLGV